MNVRTSLLFVVSFGSLALAVAGCASGKSAEKGEPTETAETESSEQAMERGGAMCPMAMENTRVEAQDVENGAAIAFTTDDPANIDELRRRVEQMAGMMSQHHHQGMGMGTGGGGMGSCPHCAPKEGGGMQGQKPPPLPHDAISEIRSEEIEGGARMVFIASSPERVEELRSAVEARADRMNAGTCPMQAM